MFYVNVYVASIAGVQKVNWLPICMSIKVLLTGVFFTVITLS